eukprot:jgi/Mesen1/10388/ME000081S09785
MQQFESLARAPQSMMSWGNADRSTEHEGPRKKPRREEPVRAAESSHSIVEDRSIRGTTSIHDLPDDLLQLILHKALSGEKKEDGEDERESLYREVSNRWRKAVNDSAKAVRLRSFDGDVDGALGGLQSFTHINKITLDENSTWSCLKVGELIRGLATGFPSLSSFVLDIDFYGWEALSGLKYFLSQRTSLHELSLGFSNLDSKEQPVAGQLSEERARALLEDVDFSNLAHLNILTLSFGRSMFPEGQTALLLSKSILRLQHLQELYIMLPGTSQVHQLPFWLGELWSCPHATLILKDEEDDGVPYPLEYSEVMSSLQRLRIGVFCKSLDATFPDTIARLQSLTALEIIALSLSSCEGSSEHGLYSPSLKRLLLSGEVGHLPVVRRPMPLLEDLVLLMTEQTSFQRNMFAFTPKLRSLRLHLPVAEEWPDFGRLPRQLRALTVLTGTVVTGDRVLADVGRLQVLETFHVSCGLLRGMAGAARLPSSTAVTVHCGCLVTMTDVRELEYKAECRKFGSFAQYAGAGQLCRFLPLAMARQWFLDSRAQLAVATDSTHSLAPASPCLIPERPRSRRAGSSTPELLVDPHVG